MSEEPKKKPLTEAAKRHGGKVLQGGIAAVVVWAVSQFPSKDEFNSLRQDVHHIRSETPTKEQFQELRLDVREIRTTVEDTQTKVEVLDAIRQNEQRDDRRLYE